MQWFSELLKQAGWKSAGYGFVAALLVAATGTAALADPPSKQCIEWRRLEKVFRVCAQDCREKYFKITLSGTAKNDDVILAKAHRQQCVQACNEKAAPYSSVSPNSPCY
jgi:hypothetical protein